MATMRTMPDTVQITKLRQSGWVTRTHFSPEKPHGGSGMGGPLASQSIGRNALK